MKKIGIVGGTVWIDRLYEACGYYQWGRETFKNSWEAGATHVEFGVEWQAVKKHGIFRRTIADNGCGMTAAEMLSFFSALGRGGKPIGGVHRNYGIGGKISLLPWNPNGVVVISYKDHKASMIVMIYDEDEQCYGLVELTGEDSRPTTVFDPVEADYDDICWEGVAPEFIRAYGHGTVIVLMGSPDEPDTVRGNPKAGETNNSRGLTKTINSRFWDISPVDVSVLEFGSDRTLWPESPEDHSIFKQLGSKVVQKRNPVGAKNFVLYDKWTEQDKDKGFLKSSGVFKVDRDRVLVEWYLWEGKRPEVGPYAQERGYIAVRYKGELYGIDTSKPSYRNFGVIDFEVQKNLTIILEPRESDGEWGVFPDNSRNTLLFIDKEVGASGPLPMVKWAHKFSKNLPVEILEEVRKRATVSSGTISDDSYRERLQEKFGDRWKTSVQVIADVKGKGYNKSPREDDEPDPLKPTIVPPITPGGGGIRGTRGGSPRKPVLRRKQRAIPDPKGLFGGSPTLTNADVPIFRWQEASAFEDPIYAAMFSRAASEGPTVFLNKDAPLYKSVCDRFQGMYPPQFHEDIVKVVRRVFGEVAVTKVAHMQAMMGGMTYEDLDETMLTPPALTLALVGFMAEENLISQQLRSFGKAMKVDKKGDKDDAE